jgi:hypothetical protein
MRGIGKEGNWDGYIAGKPHEIMKSLKSEKSLKFLGIGKRSR